MYRKSCAPTIAIKANPAVVATNCSSTSFGIVGDMKSSSSDCGAINDFWQRDERTPRHETHPDAESASADAVLNGTDLECGNSYKA